MVEDTAHTSLQRGPLAFWSKHAEYTHPSPAPFPPPPQAVERGSNDDDDIGIVVSANRGWDIAGKEGDVNVLRNEQAPPVSTDQTREAHVNLETQLAQLHAMHTRVMAMRTDCATRNAISHALAL